MSSKIKYLQVTLMYSGVPQGSFTDELDNAIHFFTDLHRDGGEGDEYVVRIVEMTKSEFDALPEFQGF